MSRGSEINPFLTAAGVYVAPTNQTPSIPQAPGQAGRSPYIDLFPQMAQWSVYFGEATVPTGVSLSTGDSAWWLLRSIAVPQITDDFAFVGLDAELWPADSTGPVLAPSSGTAMVWSDDFAMKAAVVVDRNLGLSPGLWNSRPAYIPQIEAPATAQAYHRLPPDNPREYIKVLHLPPGGYTVSPIRTNIVLARWLPTVHRFVQNDALDVALVVNGAQIAAVPAPRRLVGKIMMTLYGVRTRSLRDWGAP